MRVIVASVRTPFVQGGAEIHAEQLIKALLAAGHQADLVTIPLDAGNPERIPDQMLACALMDLEEVNGVKVDRLIALKFPAYLMPHPNKVVWLMHQHRPAYDLWNNSLGNLHNAARGVIVRDIIRRADAKMCQEAKRLFTVSENVTRRLRDFWNVDSTPLYHPPAEADLFYCADEVGDYIFFPSRISINKRQDLALRALARTRHPVRLRFGGAADDPSYGERLKRSAREIGVDSRVDWLGFLSEEEKRDTYARSLAVVFPPFDEDYGYITLEAMLASKAVITCDDSGGPLEFVMPDKTGLITPANPDNLAAAMDTLWQDRELAKKLGRAGRDRYDVLGLSWTKVVKQLLA
jgi:glycosyltransferase involved in cell wall biosynthesis